MKEFTSVAALRAHYREVLSRRPPHETDKPPETEQEPEPPPPVQLVPLIAFAGPIKKMAHIVSDYYGITVAQLRSPSHIPRLVRPRQVFCYLCRHIAKQQFPSIGRVIERDHSTVVHACRKIEKLAEHDITLANDLATITAQYNERNVAMQAMKTRMIAT